MKHIMLDLETLDTQSSAVITAIGACGFDSDGYLTGDVFHMKLGNWSEQQDRGRTVGGDTVAWWMSGETTPEAKAEMLTDQMRPEYVLSQFQQFLAEADINVQVWGNGVDFDNAILRSMYKSYGMQAPWNFRDNRCYRTINALRPRVVILPERVGVHHNALHDAEHQARCLIKIAQHMGIQL